MIDWLIRFFRRKRRSASLWSDARLARALRLNSETERRVLGAVRATVAAACGMAAEALEPQMSLAAMEDRCGEIDAAELAVGVLEAVTTELGVAWSAELESAVLTAMMPHVRIRGGVGTFSARSAEDAFGPWLFRIVRTVCDVIDARR